ncbi:MAG TPA: xanthine dehydrogenase molybdopterin binding subunit, partial [Devosia sp.]|nr:xanthine dehydrogenase molybdopterin binding subunit [Devosia sp.]
MVHQPVAHDSAVGQVSGQAVYIDDMAGLEGTCHAYLGLSRIACGTIREMDLSPVEQSEGVICVLTAPDVAGGNDISPTGIGDEPVLADKDIRFFGQPLFAVVAETRDQARRAAARARIEYDAGEPVLDIGQALEAGGELVTEPLTLSRGDVSAALSGAPRRISERMVIGGQDHFYLEGQIALAIPGEGEEMLVYSSTQHPAEVQHMVAHVLGVASHAVTVRVRRMGGGFGGKETQSNLFAAVAAMAARRTGRPVKLRPDRDDDMVATGKRHDFTVRYEVGYDEKGKIHGVKAEFAARCGFSADLSGPVTDRALFHADNAYYLPAAELVSRPLRTNTVSNTAFRGFGGPQGVLVSERMIEEIAYDLGLDPLDVRKANFYGPETGDITPYHQQVTDNIIHRIVSELEESSRYRERREAILAFNRNNDITKKGISLTPVKFGISFTATWFNQAGALLHVYQDGSIHLNHGGTEMGQGLNTKVAQVVADAFGVPLSAIGITATATDKVPNASATAASSGSDLNGMAALDAVEQIKERLVPVIRDLSGDATSEIVYGQGQVHCGNWSGAFAEVINAAYMARVHLSAAGFYKTPDIHWNRETGKGRPFFYYAYGAAVSEVSIDTLTGEYRIEQVDIL